MAILDRIPRFFIFASIGVMNTLIHGSVLSCLVELWAVPVVMANLVAFMGANLFSYFMNSYLTFRAPISLVLYAKFFSASILALGLTLLIAAVMDHLGFTYWQGMIAIVLLVPALSYFVMKTWAFAR
ncbi:hypothetical protein UB43_10365 [Pseudomonas sp. 21]|nr:hypothetical protein UB43_10365 [Pseudomonas sp. 21]